MDNTIAMQRGDVLADVHPDEVDNFRLGGWSESEDAETDELIDLVSVYKITDGDRSGRASRVDLSRDEADAWIEAHPDGEYEIVAEPD